MWEKRAAIPRLIERTPVGKPGKSPLIRSERLKVNRAILIATAAVLIAIAFLLLLLAMPEPVGPLELPAGRSVLLEGAGGGEPEDDPGPNGPAMDAGPLVLKKLSIVSYRVKAGETIPSIARKTGLDADTLISFNGISDARKVIKGTVLSVPSHRGLRYRVRPGDSLSKIGRRFNVGLDDLLDWNNLPRSVITAGQILFIPGGRLGAAAVSKVLGTLFAWPAKGRISSGFGMRVSPITGTRMRHDAIDIANDLRTPITAAADGRVARVDYNPTYGNYVILTHANGYQTLYGHLKAIRVKQGMTVAQGRNIGSMGSTGASTGSHLHFAIFKNGRPVDPVKYLR